MADSVWDWRFDQNREVQMMAGVTAAAPITDAYWQRLIKAVPVQALGFYTAGDPLARAFTGSSVTLALIGVFAFGIVLGILEMTRIRKGTTGIEITVGIVAYFVWVYAQGGVFENLGWYKPAAAALIALAFAALLYFFPKRAGS